MIVETILRVSLQKNNLLGNNLYCNLQDSITKVSQIYRTKAGVGRGRVEGKAVGGSGIILCWKRLFCCFSYWIWEESVLCYICRLFAF